MSRPPAPRHYVTVFLVSLSILMLEIAFSRVLSVALHSHYAFVAISLAMFGLGLSGLVVYLLPHHFTAAKLDEQLIAYSWRFALSAALCLAIFLQIRVTQQLSFQTFVTLSLVYIVLAVPFFLGGVCVSLLMTHFSTHISRLYAADLLGASVGCIGVVVAMQLVSAPLACVVVACIVAVGSLVLAANTGPGHLMRPAVACAVVATLLVLGSTTRLFTMRHVKNLPDYYSDYEAWNAFSRVSAFSDSRTAAEIVPLNPAATYANAPKSMMLDIDGAAWTPMMNFTGDMSSLEFLRDSVLYIAHHLKPAADVLIIGIGGGRDVLAALAFGQKSVLGLELNPLMPHLVEEHYGGYAGHPYSQPGVEVIIDEGRSRLSHLQRTFDLIQLSLIDTFSLNAAGGFVFSENYLYTTEAMREYFRHLSPDGLLSLTRYYVPEYPIEIERLAAMARTAWAAEGVKDFARQVVVLSQGVDATMLVKRSPFSQEELLRVDALARANALTVVYEPGAAAVDNGVGGIVRTADLPTYLQQQQFILDPPTDDRPFFFNFLRGLSLHVPLDPFGFHLHWREALALMYLLIAVVTILAVLFFVGPLLLLTRRREQHVKPTLAAPLLFYFGCLGYGFMMIEIPLMQRFILMLGYPVYALAVVLCALLLFSGFGSLATTRFGPRPSATLLTVLLGIVMLSLAYAYLLPPVIAALLAASLLARIMVAIALLAPIGFLLGMAYPLGITVLRGVSEGLVPWAWGLNGAMSVVASVLAIFVASRVGFTLAMLTGSGAYALALAAVGPAARSQPLA